MLLSAPSWLQADTHFVWRSRANVVRLALGLLALHAVLSNSVLAHTAANFSPLQYQGYIAPFGFDETETYTDVWGSEIGDDQIALIGSLNSGVAIINVTDSEKPETASVFGADLGIGFTDIRAVGEIGYFSTNESGTFLVDLSIPSAPSLIGSVSSTENGFDAITNAWVYHDHLFQVAGSSSTIAVIDISEPTSPQFAHRIETGDSVGIFDLTIVGERLYAAGLGGIAGEGATYVYDVRDLAHLSPSLIKRIATGADTASAWPNLDHTKLLTTQRRAGGAITAWDISDLDAALVIDSANASDLGVNAYSAGEIFMLDNAAYTAWHQAGVQVIDLELLEEKDTVFRSGAFGTSQASPLERFVGNTSVFPFGHDTVLLSDSRWGLYVVDATNVVNVEIVGDFNTDGELNASDIDLLTAEARAGTNSPIFDLNSDGSVDDADRNMWIIDVFGTWKGDSNLDGIFSSSDLVSVFSDGHYEDGIPGNSGWLQGDWNGNGEFDTGDLVAAFIDGGFERGPRANVAVPEPPATCLISFAVFCFVIRIGK